MDFGKLHLHIEVLRNARDILSETQKKGIEGLRNIGAIDKIMVVHQKNILAKGDLGKFTKMATMSTPMVVLDALSIELALKDPCYEI